MWLRFEVGQRVRYHNTEDGSPILVEIVRGHRNPSGACADPGCCGGQYDEYDVRLPDGSLERANEYELDHR